VKAVSDYIRNLFKRFVGLAKVKLAGSVNMTPCYDLKLQRVARITPNVDCVAVGFALAGELLDCVFLVRVHCDVVIELFL
jgi:hypothetical protein